MVLRTITREQQVVSACGNTVGSPLPLAQAQARAELLRALGDPVRLQLLSIIARSPQREACVCDMTELVEVSQPTVSHHLKVLVDSGLLVRERRGSWAWFRLSQAGDEEPVRSLLRDL